MSITINCNNTSIVYDLEDFRLDDVYRYYDLDRNLIEDVQQLSAGDTIIQELIDVEKENMIDRIVNITPLNIFNASDRLKDDDELVLIALDHASLVHKYIILSFASERLQIKFKDY